MKKLDENFIIELSKRKNEPAWMLDFRLASYKKFLELDNPDFGPAINIDFDSIMYYKSETDKSESDWENVDKNIRDTFCDLGVNEVTEFTNNEDGVARYLEDIIKI